MSLRHKKSIFRLMVFFVILIITPIKRTFAADSVVVIANSFSNTKKLTNTEIDDIFTFRSKKWSNGIPIKVFLLPKESTKTQEFTLRYLNMTPKRYFEILDAKGISEKNFEVVDYEYSMMIKVLTTPGGIGYVSDTFLTNFNGDVNIFR